MYVGILSNVSSLPQVLQTQLQAATAATQIQQQQQQQQPTAPVSQPPPLTSTDSRSSTSCLALPQGPAVEDTSQQQQQQQQQAVTSLLTAQLASALGIDPANPNTSQIASAGKVRSYNMILSSYYSAQPTVLFHSLCSPLCLPFLFAYITCCHFPDAS